MFSDDHPTNFPDIILMILSSPESKNKLVIRLTPEFQLLNLKKRYSTRNIISTTINVKQNVGKSAVRFCEHIKVQAWER